MMHALKMNALIVICGEGFVEPLPEQEFVGAIYKRNILHA